MRLPRRPDRADPVARPRTGSARTSAYGFLNLDNQRRRVPVRLHPTITSGHRLLR